MAPSRRAHPAPEPRRRRGKTPPPPPPQPSRLRRYWRWWTAAAALVAVALGARLFVIPATDDPAGVDAVVVLGSGAGGRLEVALELMAQGEATTLVIPEGGEGRFVPAARLCEGDAPFEVLCPPVPAGEGASSVARVVGTLSVERGWQRVALVTAEHELTRAALLLGRCTPAGVARVAAPTEADLGARMGAVAGEAAAYSWALLVRRDC